MASRHRPQFVVKPPIGHVFFTGLTRSNRKKKETTQKIGIEVRSRTCLWSVCTLHWTLRPVFVTPVEGMCVTSRHWQEFVGVAGILSLSGTRF